MFYNGSFDINVHSSGQIEVEAFIHKRTPSVMLALAWSCLAAARVLKVLPLLSGRNFYNIKP